MLNRLTAELLEKGGKRGRLSRYTVDTYIRNVNLFLGWCRREGEVALDLLRAQVPKLPRWVLDVLSREDIDRLEDVAHLERDKVMGRDQAAPEQQLRRLRRPRLRGQGAGRNWALSQPSPARNRIQRRREERHSGARPDPAHLALLAGPGPSVTASSTSATAPSRCTRRWTRPPARSSARPPSITPVPSSWLSSRRWSLSGIREPRSTSSLTTSPLTRPGWSVNSWLTTPTCRSITRRLTPADSTRSSSG